MRRMFDIRHSALDALGNRVLEVELTAVRNHPEDVRRVLRSNSRLDLRYRVSREGHLKTGAIDADDPVMRLTFEHEKDPNGVWEVVITGANGTRELWRQLIFVQTKLRQSHARIDELARTYAPIFLFSGEEKFYPVSLHTLMRSPLIQASNDVMKMKTVFGRERIPLPQLGDFMRFNGHADYLLDFNFLSMRRSIFASLGGDPKAATIYYSYFEDPRSERFYINYHLIYAFDTKAGLARLSGIGPHVFDRESMVLVFATDDADAPESMIISGHLENQRIAFLKKLKTWKQGRIRVPFDHQATLKVGTHPVIAVAEGSHALYPTSGVYQLSLLKEVAGHLDRDIVDDDGVAPRRKLSVNQVLAPPGLRSRALSSYHLASLGLDRMTSRIDEAAEGYDSHNAYLTFSGYWVDVPGTKNARFPPFTRKVSAINEWVDGAYDWSWDDLPERYHRNNGAILRFLRENAEDF